MRLIISLTWDNRLFDESFLLASPLSVPFSPQRHSHVLSALWCYRPQQTLTAALKVSNQELNWRFLSALFFVLMRCFGPCFAGLYTSQPDLAVLAQLLQPRFSAKLTNRPVELAQYFDIQLTAIVSFIQLTTMLRYLDLYYSVYIDSFNTRLHNLLGYFMIKAPLVWIWTFDIW